MERVICDNRNELLNLKKERDEYKNKLSIICEQHKKTHMNEKMAYTKLHEAVQMVEIAIAEKNAAVQREKEVRGTLHRLLWNSFVENSILS